MSTVLLCLFCSLSAKFRLELFSNEIANSLHVYERSGYLAGTITVHFSHVKLLVNFNTFDWILSSKLIAFFYTVIIKKRDLQKNCHVNIKPCIDLVFL